MVDRASKSRATHRARFGFIAAFATLVLALLAPQWIGSEATLRFPLFVPYAAMVAVYFLTAIWCVAAADGSMRRLIAEDENSADSDPRVSRALRGRRVWLAVVFGGLFLLLQSEYVGLGGVPGRAAIYSIGSVVEGGADGVRIASGAANALALTVVVQLMLSSLHIVRRGDAVRSDAGGIDLATAMPILVSCQRAVIELLQAGAAFALVSTTTLFLFFALAEEVRTSELVQPEPGPQVLECAAERNDATPGAWGVKCQLPAGSPPTKSRNVEAASIAFAVGVSFAAVLFLTLFTAGRAVDQAVGRAESAARSAVGQGKTFAASEWRKQHGLPESALSQSVIQALALFGPTAAAGLAVLLKS